MDKLIATGAAAYAGLGVVSFLRPAMVPALFGGSAPTVDARTEIRAVYGGLPLAMAGTLLAAPSSAVPLGIATAGMAVGRAASSLAEQRPPSALMAGFIAIEAGLAVALLLGGRRAHRCVASG
jgi:hypothetical protein